MPSTARHLTCISTSAPDGFLSFSSAEGVAQGDPLGPIFYCIGLRPVIDETLVQLDAIPWPQPDDPSYSPPPLPVAGFTAKFVLSFYIDDGTFGGPPHLDVACRTILPGLSQHLLGVSMNPAKFKSYPAPSAAAQSALDAAVANGSLSEVAAAPSVDSSGVPITGMAVVGVPVGSDSFKSALGAERLRKAASLLPRIVEFGTEGGACNYAQAANLIIRYCGVPKAVYTARTVDPTLIQGPLSDFQSKVETALYTINKLPQLSSLAATNPLSREGVAYSRSTLATSFGGLGWTEINGPFARAAHLGGATAATRVALTFTCPDFKELEPSLASVPYSRELGFHTSRDALLGSLEGLGGLTGSDTALVCIAQHMQHELKQPAPASDRMQHGISVLLQQHNSEKFLLTATAAQAEFTNACGMRGAKEWLVQLPITWELSLTDKQYQLSVHRRLGLDLVPDHLVGMPCPKEKCSGHLTASGGHAFVCSCGGFFQFNHDGIAAVVIKSAKSVGLSSRIATIGDIGLTQPPMTKGVAGKPPKRAKCPDTLITALPGDMSDKNHVGDVTVANVERRHWRYRLTKTIGEKNVKYLEGAEAFGVEFDVLGVNGVGGLDKAFLRLIKRLRRAASNNGLLSGREYREFNSAVIGRISATIARNSANQLSRHLTSSGESSQLSAHSAADTYWQRYSAIGSSAHHSSMASSGRVRAIRSRRSSRFPVSTASAAVMVASAGSPVGMPLAASPVAG
jgi:hypothetical protein